MDASALLPHLPTGRHLLFAVCVGVLTFFVPGIALILFVVLVDGFIASERLLTWSLVTTPIVILLYVAFFGPAFFRLLVSSVRERKEVIANGLLLIFAPILVGFVWHFFMVECIAYLLHLAEGPRASSQQEQVLYANRGTRTCRNMVSLSGDSFVLPRKVCGLTDRAIAQLRGGGQVHFEGQRSSYGFQVQTYRPDAAG